MTLDDRPKTPNREWLAGEIKKRAPWYQRIEFPEYGLSTTDDPACLVNDPAWDNLFPGMEPSDAPRLRPSPKFHRLRHLLPDLSGKTVLDVGCSCGYFALEFARRGAVAVTGIDVDATNVARAQFCASTLKLGNVEFATADVGEYTTVHDIVWGASLHEHFFFPFYYFARMLCLSRELFLLETHHYIGDDGRAVAGLDVAPTSDTLGSHAFHFSRKMYRDYLTLLRVPASAIEEKVFYEDSTVRRLLLSVRTSEFQQSRDRHPFLGILRGVGRQESTT
jgi:SAM-dependent methyltransferase